LDRSGNFWRWKLGNGRKMLFEPVGIVSELVIEKVEGVLLSFRRSWKI
jgi:hypothetical protein